MNNFFSELKRRNVVRVAIAYAVVSWVILQFVDVISDPMSLPDWFQKVTIVFLGIGFPIALLLSWAYEVTSEGVMKTAEVDKSKSVTHGTGQKINKLIIGGLGLAVAFLLYDKFILTPDQQVFTEARAAQTSIAVLPFVNMSSDPEQEFFSDGITEEILNVLAKNKSLKVAGRTSSFAYKGENQDLRAIGEALGVDYLVEGSIRKAGNTVRITAQVVNASDGFHLWSETYDRELTDIFTIQDEIARSVSDALQVSFGLAEGESLVSNTTSNMAAYDLYLKAKDAHKFRRIGEALEVSKQVIAMEPDFAPGWAVYAQVEALAPYYIHANDWLETAGAIGRAKIAAEKALILDPNSIDALGALANVYRARLQWTKSEAAYLRGLEVDPDSPVILEDYGEFLIAVGKIKEARAVADKLIALEPTVPIYLNLLKNAFIGQLDFENAVKISEKMIELDPTVEVLVMQHLRTLIVAGEFEKALEFFKNTTVLSPENREVWGINLKVLQTGFESLTPEELALALDSYFVLAHSGQKDLLFKWLTDNVKLGFWGTFFTFLPEMRPYFGTPEFKNHMIELELPPYWRKIGWPDYCKPVGDDDFECD
ncbi:MAG: hypothetical protein IH995_09960 [Proteobacteria bacterium]|nr:hypothetical protein [Pseudomonadota bacterium]